MLLYWKLGDLAQNVLSEGSQRLKLFLESTFCYFVVDILCM